MSEDKLDIILSRMDKHDDDMKEWKDKMEDRLGKTEEQLFLYKTAIRILKGVGMLLLLVITLKFGDIGKFFAGKL